MYNMQIMQKNSAPAGQPPPPPSTPRINGHGLDADPQPPTPPPGGVALSWLDRSPQLKPGHFCTQFSRTVVSPHCHGGAGDLPYRWLRESLRGQWEIILTFVLSWAFLQDRWGVNSFPSGHPQYLYILHQLAPAFRSYLSCKFAVLAELIDW